jgi:hypothetical protein
MMATIRRRPRPVPRCDGQSGEFLLEILKTQIDFEPRGVFAQHGADFIEVGDGGRANLHDRS